MDFSGRRAFVRGDEVAAVTSVPWRTGSVAQADLVLSVGNLHGVTGDCGADQSAILNGRPRCRFVIWRVPVVIGPWSVIS